MIYKFLLIEDSESDIKSCTDTVDRLNDECGTILYEIAVARTFDDAMKLLNKQYHGVIVDIKLQEKEDGNAIIENIVNQYRVPVAVMTGTPDTKKSRYYPIVVYIKGKHEYAEIFKDLKKQNDTGLFNVIGGVGKIERCMNQIFWKNLYPMMPLWKQLKDQGLDAETILTRYAVSHIQEIVDFEGPEYITEEMYIKPPLNQKIQTGSVVKEQGTGLYYIVLSPPCDLAEHNGKPKSENVLLCTIDSIDMVYGNISTDRKGRILQLIKNNHQLYYHWLPENDLFVGGYINFQKVHTVSYEEIEKQYDKPEIKIQDCFVKNILNRFSGYYARQGQPDFNFKEELSKINAKYRLWSN